MGKKLQILTVCGFGVGSSIFLKINIEKILREKQIKADVSAADVSSASGFDVDVIFTAKEYEKLISDKTSIPVFSIKNFLNRQEIEEIVLEALDDIDGLEN
ncbi:MAG: PTS sugar transporter subunit IIB [Proteocatella sp.]